MDIGGNMKNPFLFDDPAPPPSGEEAEVGNPFLNGGAFDFSATSYSGINPFSDQVDDTSAAAMNIFGDQPSYVPEMNPFGIATPSPNLFDQSTEETAPPVDFFGSVSQEHQPPVDLFGDPPSQPAKAPPPRPPSPSTFTAASDTNMPGRPPPPRPPPPSKETKDLLQTVIGAMEATTDTLQDKLNTAVTPCPSPRGAMGMHTSRSPTPDIQITAPDKEPDAFSTIFGQTIELSDQEVDESHTSTGEISTTTSDFTSTFAPSDAAPSSTTVSSDEIDLFGDPIAQAKTKTTQDILSLFNKPAGASQQVDLLSDDLISDGPSDSQTTEKNENPESSAIDIFASKPEMNNEANSSVDVSPKLPEVTDNKDEDLTSDETVSPEPISIKKDVEPPTTESNEIRADISEKDSTLPYELSETKDSACIDTITNVESSQLEIENKDELSKFSTEDVVSNEELKPEIDEKLETKVEDVVVDQIFGISNSAPTEIAKQEVPVADAVFPPEFSTPNVADMFGGEPQIAPVETVTMDNVFGGQPEPEPSSPASFFGIPDNSAPHPTPSVDNVFGGQPEPEPSSPASFFGIPDNSAPHPTPSVDNVFGGQPEPEPSSPASFFGIPDNSAPHPTPSMDNVFGGQPEPEPSSPASFFGIPDNSAPHPTPSSATSTGFDLFGGGEPAPASPLSTVPSGAETTGASLFETEAPAPNVGMSLFGAGEGASLDIFAESAGNTMINPFAPPSPVPTSIATLASVTTANAEEAIDEEFDAFSARFDNVTAAEAPEAAFDPFTSGNRAASPWGDAGGAAPAEGFGFGDDAKFDPFLSLNEPPPPPQSTPRRVKRDSSKDSDEVPMNVVIRPANLEGSSPTPMAPSPLPVLAPPPASLSTAFTDSTPRFNPFDKSGDEVSEAVPPGVKAFPGQGELQRSESQETPPTPLFEEDQSVPLEPYIRTHYDGRTWEMHLRQPNKKKITGQRFWKKVFVKLTDAGALQLFNNLDDKEPFQELPLQPCYSVSDIGAQQFDQFGKIFTVKVQYIFYKERPGVRPGQISKAERITNKLSKFAQYAIAGDYEGVKEFASDVRKLGMPVEHAPQISQLLKLGTQNYEELKLFASLIEEFMFKLVVHRDRALTYKSEEVQLTAVDELYVEQDLKGAVTQMVARVRIFFLGFLTGMPEVDLGINDLRKQGHEVVGRHDIIPVITEEWIRLEDIEFHCTVDTEVFDATRHIKFKPPDASYIELMRFRVRPPKNRELPLQVKTKFVIQGKRIDIHCEILVPGFSGRKLGQVPCEDVAVRFPLPESWIYMFRVEKHFRYGSVKSAHRRTGKVKGIERLKGAVEAPDAALMEVTSGQAKYEHQHRAIVWRMSRLPKEGQGAYSVHQFTCRMNLTAYDQVPPTLDRFCVLEFTMPATTVSHCVMRSVSVTSEDPPEKYVRYLARHEYKIEIEFSSGQGPNEYLAATMVKEAPKEGEKKEVVPPTVQEESSSDESA